MKAFLIGIAVICVSMPSIVRSGFAQDVDPRCNDIYDKVACGCALQNGGRVIPPPVGVKRQGWKLHPREAPQSTRTLDGGRVAFHSYFRREGLKIHRSAALEGYLACMRRNGRK
jgi:hypothetical protein